SNLPNRQHRLINFYNLKPDYKKVLQPFKNPNDKRIKERIKKGVKGARSYDWFNDIQLVKNVTKQEHNHPCPVPVKLMERIIKLTTKENDLIFDPFAGSGTTTIACITPKEGLLVQKLIVFIMIWQLIGLVKVVISINNYTRYEVELTIFGENIKMYDDLSNEVPGDLIDDFIQMEVFQYLRDSVRYVYYQKII